MCALPPATPPPPLPLLLNSFTTHCAHLTWRTFHFHQIDTVNIFQSWRKTLHLPHQYPSLVSSFILAETDSIHSTWQVPRLGWGQHTFTHETNESCGQWQRRTPNTKQTGREPQQLWSFTQAQSDEDRTVRIRRIPQTLFPIRMCLSASSLPRGTLAVDSDL